MDSLVEIGASNVVIWQLRGTGRDRERHALRLISIAFFALAVYILAQSFSGDYCRVDRQGRESVVLRSPCLAALWFTQPDKVETLLAERSLTDGGLLS